MDTFETPYDEESEFIECKICQKSIRGDTLYKIHLTSPGHIKREDSLVALGLAVKRHNVPVFEDILHYLDYMKLDEPIIGLNYLEEMPCNDSQGDPSYTCRLCNQTAHLTEMIRHVIGRRHRQKYVEQNRPDLVTWDNRTAMTQGGKAIRARAEIIERQDGRGSPKPMAKKGKEGRLNMSQGPPRQKQYSDQNVSQSSTQRGVPSRLPSLLDFLPEFSDKTRFSSGQPNKPSSHPEDPSMLDRDGQKHQRENVLSHLRMEEEVRRANYRESDEPRREYMDPDYRREKGEYVRNPQRRDMLEPSGVPMYDSRMDMSHSQGQQDEYYPEEEPSYRRPDRERDQLKEFYSEEVRRGRVRSAEYQPSPSGYLEDDNHRWSVDSETGGYESVNRAGSSEPEAKRRSLPGLIESDPMRDQLFNNRDYGQKIRELHQMDAAAKTGSSRTGPPNSLRQMEVASPMSDIPEPFRRFLTGSTNDGGFGKRKRKSRFSDATAEEVETTKEMFGDDYGASKFARFPRPGSPLSGRELHGKQHPDLYMESQGPHHTESYQSGGSESAGVFDMLKNIEIDNAEEADFLKNKLCNLLKEFKAKKSGKAGQNSHNRAVLSKDPELSSRHHYEPIVREDLDLRRTEDIYFEADQRGRVWKQQEKIPDERFQDYPVRGEHRHPDSNASRYEDIFGGPELSVTQHATRPDEPTRFPERFQEPMHSCVYPPPAEEFLDAPSSAPYCMERGPRMDRGPRYSNSLEKITSTLLELVARK